MNERRLCFGVIPGKAHRMLREPSLGCTPLQPNLHCGQTSIRLQNLPTPLLHRNQHGIVEYGV